MANSLIEQSMLPADAEIIAAAQKTIGSNVSKQAFLKTIMDNIGGDKSKITAVDVAQYANLAAGMGFNPADKSLYAFKRGDKLTIGVTADGWRKAVTSQPSFAGCRYEYGPMVKALGGKACFSSCTCFLKKMMANGTVVEIPATAWLDEEQQATDPWKARPKRMLEQRAFALAARCAYAWGAYDDAEAREFEALRSAPLMAPSNTTNARILAAISKSVKTKDELLLDYQNATSLDDLKAVWANTPANLRADEELLEAGRVAKAALEKEPEPEQEIAEIVAEIPDEHK